MINNKKLCDWGDKVGTDDDSLKCNAVAVGIVAVRDGARVHAVATCMRHRMMLISETDPVARR